jgi:dienelactone hydrolase
LRVTLAPDLKSSRDYFQVWRFQGKMHYKSIEVKGLLPILLVFSFTAHLGAQPTVALFQPNSLGAGPFPSDILTVHDEDQKTHLRVDLPASNANCDFWSSPAVCSNIALLNQLDGFSVNPRLMVCFSAAVDPKTLVSGISITPLDSGPAVGINQIIFDPPSNCAFAKPNEILNQQSRYLMTVTNSIHDTHGKKVTEDEAFKDCLESDLLYCQELDEALEHLVPGASKHNVIAASLFTTMSATTWLEEARRYVSTNQPAVVLPAGYPFSFKLADIKRITWVPSQSGLPPQAFPLKALSGVKTIAFGLYLSPNFLDPSTGTIPVMTANTPIGDSMLIPGIRARIPRGFVLVSFHLFLPAGPRPPDGFPIVIYGHGLGDSQFGAPTFIASTLAKNGFATVAIEITGHGYGRGSTVNVTDSNNVVHTVFTPGRGILIPGNTQIGSADGCIVPGAVAVRDCARQTAVDLFALSETIQKTGGFGVINPKRVYYVGQSFGSTYGTLFHAVEPNVRAAVVNGDGGTSVDVARLGISGRSLGIEYLATLGLLNVPPAPPEAYFHDAFNDNYVFRGASAVVNEIPGAMAIQAAFEAADWLGMLGDPLAYAPHLKTSPLDGVPKKSTLFQFGYGDLEVSNPTESAVIRAADAQSSSWLFRFEQATLKDGHPELLGVMMPGVPFPILPHRILSNPTIFDVPAETSISLAEQQQVASYFASDGESNPDPNQFVTAPFSPGMNLFQVPIALPERLNFLQISP